MRLLSAKGALLRDERAKACRTCHAKGSGSLLGVTSQTPGRIEKVEPPISYPILLLLGNSWEPNRGIYFLGLQGSGKSIESCLGSTLRRFRGSEFRGNPNS